MNENKKTEKPKTLKKGKYGLYSALISVVVIALVIMANLLVSVLENTLNLRTDLSQSRIYSLTNETQKVVKSLEEPILIYSLYKPSTENKTVKELLTKYKASSPKISYENVDPVKNPSFTEDFDPDKKGIAVNSIIVTDEAKTRYKVIPERDLVLQDTTTGEVDLRAEQCVTAAINYIETGVVKSVKILSGHNEVAWSNYNKVMTALASRGYELAGYNAMTSAAALDPKNDTLLIVNPQSDISDDEFTKLKTFLQDGGKALFIMQNFSVDTSTSQIQMIQNDFPNFKALLLLYDLSVNKDLVIGQDSTRFYKQNTSLIPDMQTQEILNPIIQAGGNVVLSVNSSINVPQVASGDVTVTPLLVTDAKCYAKSIANLKSLSKESGDKEGQYVIGALAQKGDTKIALYTSDSFFIDSDISTAKNYDLAFNTLSYLSEQKDSITIAPKRLNADVLEIQSQAQKDLLSWIIIAVIPAGILVAGFLVWMRRRRL